MCLKELRLTLKGDGKGSV